MSRRTSTPDPLRSLFRSHTIATIPVWLPTNTSVLVTFRGLKRAASVLRSSMMTMLDTPKCAERTARARRRSRQWLRKRRQSGKGIICVLSTLKLRISQISWPRTSQIGAQAFPAQPANKNAQSPTSAHLHLYNVL